VSLEESFITRGPDGPALLGAHCAGCGAVFYPARPVCGACGSATEDEAMPVGRHAWLQRFTISNVAPAGIEAPYVLGFVRLREGPELLARIVPAFEDWSQLAPGRRLTLHAGEGGFHYVAEEEPEDE
jgi:uncharacterized OB-fold protein